MADYDIPTLKEEIDRETVEQVLALDVDKYKYGFETEIESDVAPPGLTEDIGITRFCAFTLHAKTNPADPDVRRWVGEVFITHMLPVMAARALDENYDFPARVMELN